MLGDRAEQFRRGGARELAHESRLPALREHALPHRAGAQGREGHQPRRLRQPFAQRGRLAGLERRLDAGRQHGSVVQVHREDLAGHALDRGHRAECLEGVEDVLDVVVHPPPQAHQAERAEEVQVEVGLDRLPHGLRQPGHRDGLFHAVDRGHEVGHDHVVNLLRRGGRLVGPDGTADGGADVERRLERALPQGLGVGQQRTGLRHPEQAGALPPDQPGLQGPAHDQVQAGKLGGAVELQALVAGAEQRDEFPGVGGPDVLRGRERPSFRAEPRG